MVAGGSHVLLRGIRRECLRRSSLGAKGQDEFSIPGQKGSYTSGVEVTLERLKRARGCILRPWELAALPAQSRQGVGVSQACHSILPLLPVPSWLLTLLSSSPLFPAPCCLTCCFLKLCNSSDMTLIFL